jgi:hypothetical protein
MFGVIGALQEETGVYLEIRRLRGGVRGLAMSKIRKRR